jgi:Ca2+-binding RTX toxin-like protein
MANHNEATDGDLSNTFSSPTSIVLSSGNNIVTGSTTPTDRDFFTLTVPAGSTVSAIFLQAYTGPDGSYFALDDASSFSTISDDSNFVVSTLIDDGRTLNGINQPSEVGQNLLAPGIGNDPRIPANPPIKTGSGQLGPGTYSVWYQELAGNTTYQFNIVLDTPPPPTIQFSQPTYQVNEDGSIVGTAVTLTRTGNLNIASAVQVSITGGSATAGSDYNGSAFPLSINFASGETSKTVTIPILQDTVAEVTEDISLKVISSSNATIGTQDIAALQILDDDNPTGSGGQKTFVINRGDSITITDFGGVGRGTNPSPTVVAEVDTLKFQGAGLTARNLLLTQNGADLEITFEGVTDTKVTLQNFELENLENLAGLGNILFDGQTTIADSFDVFDADSTRNTIFNQNTVTFLNDLNNNVTGFNNSADVINGQRGKDRIDGQGGDDLLRGGYGKDTCLGGNGKDILVGGDNKDSLMGGNGKDTLTGGEGKDKFSFNSPTEGMDTITDFSVVDDIIQVAKAGFDGGLKRGTLKADQFVIGSSAQDRSDRFIYNQSTGALFFDVDGTGRSGPVQIATLSTGLAMTRNNIHVIA